MITNDQGNDLLKDRLNREMRQRGLTARQISARGGPSGPTLAAILRGEGARLDSLAKLDHALDWVQGSCALIRQGGDPERLDTHEISIQESLSEATPEQLLEELSKRLGAH